MEGEGLKRQPSPISDWFWMAAINRLIDKTRMGKTRHPHRGSMQFWPRKRAKETVARVRSWSPEKNAKPLGFIGFKVGMTHLQITDNRPKALTKGETVAVASTIVECPPLLVVGIAYYKKTAYGWRKVASVLTEKLPKELARTFPLPKKKSVREINGYDDLRLLVSTQPKTISTSTKKPQLVELALGGSLEEKLTYAREKQGKELLVGDVLASGMSVDAHGITKGKGFQGTVKRFGVPIRNHKSEKTKRGIGNLGSWTPKRVQFTVAQPGKMGYHLRTEYNKQIITIRNDSRNVALSGGFAHYGLLKSSYLLVRGSLAGPTKRALFLTKSIRPNSKIPKEAPEITHISTAN